MITLNNVKFAETEKELIDSLFHNNGTCSGYAKRLKRKIELYDLQKQLIGVINKHGVLCNARLLETGKVWYSYATISLIGEYESYSQEWNDIEPLRVSSDEQGYIYKL